MGTFSAVRADVPAFETPAAFAGGLQRKLAVHAETVGCPQDCFVDAMRGFDTRRERRDFRVAAAIQRHVRFSACSKHPSANVRFFLQGKSRELNSSPIQFIIKGHKGKIAMPDPFLCDHGQYSEKRLVVGFESFARTSILAYGIEPPKHPFRPNKGAQIMQRFHPLFKRGHARFKVRAIVDGKVKNGIVQADELFKQRMLD